MAKFRCTMAKKVTPEEQALKDILRANIKKYRHRRNWSQFALAAKIDISTNFMTDIEAGNTWVSAQTLAKLAQAFEIEAFELLIPQKEEPDGHTQQESDRNKELIDQFSQDLSIVLQETMKKSIDHVRKQYEIY